MSNQSDILYSDRNINILRENIGLYLIIVDVIINIQK